MMLNFASEKAFMKDHGVGYILRGGVPKLWSAGENRQGAVDESSIR